MKWIEVDELTHSVLNLRSNGGVVVLVDLSSVDSRASLDATMRRSIPLDPRIEGAQPNWDGLLDSMFGGFEQMGVERALLAFTHARSILGLKQEVRDVLDDVLAQLVVQLAVPRPSGAGMDLGVFFEASE